MPDSLEIEFQNQTSSNTVFAYITGHHLGKNALFLLQSDGRTGYFPESPPSIGTRLAKDCAIPLGAPGHSIRVTIPQIAGGRIWFSVNEPLTFLLNPGPALVEPSVTNPTDPNIDVNWGFCEFTLNNDQLYANISYVDFVGLPIALKLQTRSGQTQYVTGMPPGGLDRICDGLKQQSARDHRGWGDLVVRRKDGGGNLRVLSPNNGHVMNPQLFGDYFEEYVGKVFHRYSHGGSKMRINTQAGLGKIEGKVENDSFVFGGQRFNRPSTADIFGCNSGPFQTGPDGERNSIIPRLAAAFNRTTALTEEEQPPDHHKFYREDITNHYGKIVHSVQVDGKGYTFPYDDVTPDGGEDQSGKVNAGDPILWTIAVGGGTAKSWLGS